MFKVGDKVRIVKNESGFMFDKYIGKIGEVKDFFKIGIHNLYHIEFEDKSLGSTNWNCSELELVIKIYYLKDSLKNKLKVGDRVKIIKNISLSCFDDYFGKIGTIKEINETGIKYTVRMDSPTLKNVKWNEDELELISSSKFKVGDKVKRISGNHMCGMKTGDVGTVAEVNINLIRLKEYENWYHFESKFVKINDSFKTNKVTVQDKIDKLREKN